MSKHSVPYVRFNKVMDTSDLLDAKDEDPARNALVLRILLTVRMHTSLCLSLVF